MDSVREGKRNRLHCPNAALVQNVQANWMHRLQTRRQGKRCGAVRVIEFILYHPANTPTAPKMDVEIYMHARIAPRNTTYWVTML